MSRKMGTATRGIAYLRLSLLRLSLPPCHTCFRPKWLAMRCHLWLAGFDLWGVVHRWTSVGWWLNRLVKNPARFWCTNLAWRQTVLCQLCLKSLTLQVAHPHQFPFYKNPLLWGHTFPQTCPRQIGRWVHFFQHLQNPGRQLYTLSLWTKVRRMSVDGFPH